MEAIVLSSLSGGQGKTTSCLLLARVLAERGNRILLVDTDPQGTLSSDFLGIDAADSATLYEVLTGKATASDAIRKTQIQNVEIIPADSGLSAVQNELTRLGNAAIILRNKLKPISDSFDYAIVDSGPSDCQLAIMAIGAADKILISAEIALKGVSSFARTLSFLDTLKDAGVLSAQIVGVIPMFDKFFGKNRASDCVQALAAIRENVNGITCFSPFRDSEKIKYILHTCPQKLGNEYVELLTPFSEIADKLESVLKGEIANG